jgi:hypothetical protein
MSTEITVYDKINSMTDISTFGDAMAAIMQCNPAQGRAMAIQCMFERKPPLEMAKTYHLVSGKLVKRADAMLADFRRAGGKWHWKNIDEPTKQEAAVTWEGNQHDVAYTIQQATDAGYVKKDSNWTKDPAPMLRARLVSRTLRAIAPELVQGVYSEADIDEEAAPTRNEPRNVTPPEQVKAVAEKLRETLRPTVVVEAVADDPFAGQPAAVDYDVVPVGINKGKRWIELPRETLDRVIANPGPLSAEHIAAVKQAIDRTPY